MKYSEIIGGIFWLLFGITFTVLATGYQIGSVTQPGPGFLPLGVGVLLIVFSLVLLGQGVNCFKNIEKVVPFSKPGGLRKVGYIASILLVLAFLFEKMGFLITVFLLVALSMLEAEFKSWKKIVFMALVTTIGAYILFVLLLSQQLPRGFLGM
ncbi:MAG: tripartite tricarboxylate transporter TctB family protein [Deltaproteobacteria bacterium]|nr:tripartite tricarboxylate transporter TctB family protein [Deltaproteobacteria bacterium]MBI3060124.1 tripartite tricarboxylate transporter TctB family protein [Deltaproteobacteria bacterium]